MVDATTESRICAHGLQGDSRRCQGCGRDLRGSALAEARRQRALGEDAAEARRRAGLAEEARPASEKLARALHLLPALSLAGFPGVKP